MPQDMDRLAQQFRQPLRRQVLSLFFPLESQGVATCGNDEPKAIRGLDGCDGIWVELSGS